MSSSSNSLPHEHYENYIKNEIFVGTDAGITAVNNLVLIRTYSYSDTILAEVADSIRAKKELPKQSTEFGEPREYLEVFNFTDQADRLFFVLIYDSDELWQNPTIIGLFNPSSA